MVTWQTWRDRMSEDMRLRDFRPRTQRAYLATARQFVEWCGKAPEDLTEEDVRRYFLFLRETKQLAPSSINLAVHGADKVLEYLGRYVHRTAISDRALIAMDDRSVTFRYRDSRDHRHKALTLPPRKCCGASCSTSRPKVCIASARSGCFIPLSATR